MNVAVLFNNGLATPGVVLNALKYLNIPVDKVQFIIGSSLDEIPKLLKNEGSDRPLEKFDYILVDGLHEPQAAARDLQMITPLARGYVIFDDLINYNLKPVWDSWRPKDFEFFEYKNVGIARHKNYS